MSNKNKKTKREAYLPLIGYIVMGILTVIWLIVRYYRWEKGFSILSPILEFISLILIILIFAVCIYTFIVMIRYILIIAKKDVETWKKVLWVILLFQFNVLAFPVFWRSYIKDRTQETIETEQGNNY